MDFESIKSLISMPVEQIFYDGMGELESKVNKIEYYPLMHLISNSIFLNITGFLEQKFLVVHSFYRIHSNSDYGFSKNNSFSTYKTKENLYNDLKKLVESFSFDKSVLERRLQDYNDKIFKLFCYNTIDLNSCDSFNLLEEKDKTIYEDAIFYRNRIAHNVFARQSLYLNEFNSKFFVSDHAWLDYIKVFIVVDFKFTQLSKKFLNI